VHLAVNPDIAILMDVVFIDVPDACGMLLSQKWATSLGGSLQMDLSFSKFPTCDNTFVRLNREQKKRYHVKDPNDPMNELVYEMGDLGNYVILSNSLSPIKENFKEEKVDDMNLDESHSKTGT